MKRRASKGFTLVELLVVIAIMGIMIGLAAPAFRGGGRGSKAQTAMSQLSSQMSLARQMAITTRQHVHILFPDNGLTYNSNTLKLAYAAYAIYGERDGYIGEWRQLPDGIIFDDAFRPPPDTGTQPFNVFLQNPATYAKPVPFPNRAGALQNVMAFTYRPDGVLHHAGINRKGVYVTEGWVDDSSGSLLPEIRPNNTVHGLEIRPETGQSRVREYNLDL